MNKPQIYNKLIYIIPIVYIIAVSAYMVWHRAWLSPDQFFAFAILATIFIGRTKQFLRDWIPVLLLLFGYEYLRGIVPYLTKNVNIWPMIRADEFLFGYLPTIKLQATLFDGVTLHWYDYVAVTLYITHFIIPMVVAFVFWMYDRKIFKEYTATFLVLSYLAFFTFIIFPAMPPWMASNQGYIPPLKKIMDQVMVSFAHPIDVPSVYRFFGANLVAAVPSLHAAYPWLIFIFLLKKFRGLSIFALPYVAGVWFAVVYLGEHYVVDVILGFVYA
ncbi:MAG: phosphatase PAP2 family protein, partial [Candidatus Gottesmanbacteria bacterium]|nr:phosphatase PAP2 family protein [Candidatus Gottesmanbacteria bacterium]